jgi:hypothetical protein
MELLMDDELFDAIGEGDGFRFVGEGADGGPKWMIFECPWTGQDCRIALRPNQTLANGASWSWDGNREAPTINPSINCGGCGWHGFVRGGKFEPAK